LLDGGEPFYGIYRCLDGKFLSVAAVEPQFRPICSRIGAAAKRQPEEIAVVIASRTRDQWAAHFAGTDACVAPVLDLGEAPVHPHNGCAADLPRPGWRVPASTGAALFGHCGRSPRSAAREGQDGEAILAELGYGTDEIRAILKAD